MSRNWGAVPQRIFTETNRGTAPDVQPALSGRMRNQFSKGTLATDVFSWKGSKRIDPLYELNEVTSHWA